MLRRSEILARQNILFRQNDILVSPPLLFNDRGCKDPCRLRRTIRLRYQFWRNNYYLLYSSSRPILEIDNLFGRSFSRRREDETDVFYSPSIGRRVYYLYCRRMFILYVKLKRGEEERDINLRIDDLVLWSDKNRM